MPPHFRAGANLELPDGLVRSRLGSGDGTAIVRRQAQSRHVISAVRAVAKTMPPHFRAGANLELPDGLVRSRLGSGDGTAIVRRQAQSRHVISAVRAVAKTMPPHFRAGASMELLAGLEPATFCHPKKMRRKEARRVGAPFFGDPVWFNLRSDGFKLRSQTQKENTP